MTRGAREMRSEMISLPSRGKIFHMVEPAPHLRIANSSPIPETHQYQAIDLFGIGPFKIPALPKKWQSAARARVAQTMKLCNQLSNALVLSAKPPRAIDPHNA